MFGHTSEQEQQHQAEMKLAAPQVSIEEKVFTFVWISGHWSFSSFSLGARQYLLTCFIAQRSDESKHAHFSCCFSSVEHMSPVTSFVVVAQNNPVLCRLSQERHNPL